MHYCALQTIKLIPFVTSAGIGLVLLRMPGPRINLMCASFPVGRNTIVYHYCHSSFTVYLFRCPPPLELNKFLFYPLIPFFFLFPSCPFPSFFSYFLLLLLTYLFFPSLCSHTILLLLNLFFSSPSTFLVFLPAPSFGIAFPPPLRNEQFLPDPKKKIENLAMKLLNLTMKLLSVPCHCYHDRQDI